MKIYKIEIINEAFAPDANPAHYIYYAYIVDSQYWLLLENRTWTVTADKVRVIQEIDLSKAFSFDSSSYSMGAKTETITYNPTTLRDLIGQDIAEIRFK